MKQTEPQVKFEVLRTKPLVLLLKEVSKTHPAFEGVDLPWLEGRIRYAPTKMGDHIPGLKNLNLPVFKARLKDSCVAVRAKQDKLCS